MCSENLVSIGGPGVGDDHSFQTANLRDDIEAVFCAGDYAVQTPELGQHDRSAGLEAYNTGWMIGHSSLQFTLKACL